MIVIILLLLIFLLLVLLFVSLIYVYKKYFIEEIPFFKGYACEDKFHDLAKTFSHDYVLALVEENHHLKQSNNDLKRSNKNLRKELDAIEETGNGMIYE